MWLHGSFFAPAQVWFVTGLGYNLTQHLLFSFAYWSLYLNTVFATPITRFPVSLTLSVKLYSTWSINFLLQISYPLLTLPEPLSFHLHKPCSLDIASSITEFIIPQTLLTC